MRALYRAQASEQSRAAAASAVNGVIYGAFLAPDTSQAPYFD